MDYSLHFFLVVYYWTLNIFIKVHYHITNFYLINIKSFCLRLLFQNFLMTLLILDKNDSQRITQKEKFYIKEL